MLRFLGMAIVIGSFFTAGYAQSSSKPESPYYVTARGKCGLFIC